MNLNPARIAVIAALAIGGILILSKGFSSDSSAMAEPSGVPTVSVSSPSDIVSPSEPPTPATDVEPNEPAAILFQVLNGTSVAGLASAVDQALVDDGFIEPAAEPADAPTSTYEVTTVYFSPGEDETEAAQNEADANVVAESLTDEDAKPAIVPVVEELPKTVAKVADPIATVVVVAGQDYADTLAPAI